MCVHKGKLQFCYTQFTSHTRQLRHTLTTILVNMLPSHSAAHTVTESYPLHAKSATVALYQMASIAGQ